MQKQHWFLIDIEFWYITLWNNVSSDCTGEFEGDIGDLCKVEDEYRFDKGISIYSCRSKRNRLRSVP
jgi:hypothetical protein